MSDINILTIAWDNYPRIHKLKKEVAERLYVFKNKRVSIHMTERGDIEVLIFRKITSMAMELLLEFLNTGKMPSLTDSYFYAAFPDLLRFINDKFTNEECKEFKINEFRVLVELKILYSLTRSEDIDVEKTKKTIKKYKVPITEEYEKYF